MIMPSTRIDWKHYHFLIMNVPTKRTEQHFIRELIRNNVGLVVRFEDADFDEQIIRDKGIDVIDMLVEQGNVPDKNQIQRWNQIVDDFFDNFCDLDTQSGDSFELRNAAQNQQETITA